MMHPPLGDHAKDWPRHEFSWAGLNCCLIQIEADRQTSTQPERYWWNGYVYLPPSHAYHHAHYSIIPVKLDYELSYSSEKEKGWVGFSTDRRPAPLGEVSYLTKTLAKQLSELADVPIPSDQYLLKLIDDRDWNRDEMIEWTLRRRLS